MRNFPVIIPPEDKQSEFAAQTQAQASLNHAENLFNSLLQRAFKGELVAAKILESE